MAPLNNRIVLDANVLLTGMFVPHSKSRQVLDGSLSGRYSAYILENTIEESENVLARVAQETGIDLIRPFRDSLAVANLIRLPRIPAAEGQAYTAIRGTADKAIAAAAAKISASICTNDLADFQRGGQYGLSIITPQQLTDDGSVGLHTVFPGLLATPSQGAIYASIGKLGWAEVKFSDHANAEFYVYDWQGVCACYFEARSRSFVARFDNGPTIRVLCNGLTATSPPIRLIATYDCTSEASLYVGTTDKAFVLANWIPTAPPNARVKIGSDRHGRNPLNGCIYLTYGVPYRVNDRAARNMINDVTVHNPWERLSLKDMIKICVLGTR
jgi:predicted nucleic acid-binding protein